MVGLLGGIYSHTDRLLGVQGVSYGAFGPSVSVHGDNVQHKISDVAAFGQTGYWGGGVARQGAFSNSFCALRCNASFLVMLPFDFWRNSDLFEKKEHFSSSKTDKVRTIPA